MKPVGAEPDDKAFAWPEDFPFLPHLRFSTLGNENVTEVMETYRIACEQLGFSTSIEPKLSVDHKDINIWFFAMGLRWTSDADLPLNTIVVNLEPQLPELLSKMPVYRHLLQRAWVWDYSMDNIKHHQSLGIHRSQYVPLTFDPKATPILPEDQLLHDAEQDIDVIFFGERTPRRLAVLKELESRELNVVYPFAKPWTPAERDALLLRAKIGLNISKDDGTATAEMARFSILLRNRKAVVSELYPHSEIPSQLRDALDGCSYNKLVERTVKLLGDAPRRHMLERRAVAALNNLTPQKDILRDAMRTYVKAVRQHMQRNPKVLLRENVSLESVDMNSETNVGAAVQGIDQIWLINLDRRRDRLEGFMQRHPEMHGRINRLPAYDGKSLKLTPALARLFLPNNFEWHKPTMGCALSHLALWQKLAAEPDDNASYLILEDDALLAPSWVSTVEKAFQSQGVPPAWEVVYLGGILPKYREHFDANVEPLNRSIAKVKADCVFGNNPPGYYHFCAYAYLLSKRGALRIFEIVKGGNGVWMQADFLAAYTTPQLTPPRPIYFFNPLIAQSFQDTAEGLVRPYDESGLPTDKVDSDIWKESDKFSTEEVSRCEAVDLPLDMPAALGWKQSESGEAWVAADKKQDAPAEPSPATQGSVVSNTTMDSGTVIPQNLGHMVLEGHLGGFFSEGDGGTYYPLMWSHLVRKYRISSVLDVGCGRGYSTLYFQSLGCRIKGIDGSKEAADTNLIGKDFVLADYTLGPAPIEDSFDLAWSCEFVEHVEEKFMGNYLQDFCRARFLAMTFAGPGQPGHHHVNCRPAEYWIRVLHAHGFDYLPEYTAEMRELAKQDMEKNDRETDKRFVYHFIHRGLVFRRNALFQGRSVTSDTKINSGS